VGGVRGIPFPVLSGFCSPHRVLNMNSPTVATSQVLQHLYSLDNTSPDLLPNLRHLIQNDDKEQYLSGLQGADLVRLVDFLDKVRRIPHLLSS